MATATVIAITGQAWARDEDGNLRELRIGDVLQEGETLITSADGRVELDFADGTGANVVEGGQEVAVTSDLVSDLIVATDASAQDDDLEALLAALDDEDGDLLDILDATAAGAGAGGGGGGGGGGNSFVRVARIAEETDPLSFNTEGGLEGAEFVEFDGGDVAAADAGAGEGVVDATPPTLTVDAPTGNDTTPIITGSSDEIGGTVSVIVTDSAGNIQELEAVVNPDGTWSVDVTTPLAEGDYTVDASITDPAGNGATASDSGAIDTTAPTLTVDAPNGNDTTPTIIGTSDQIGGTVSVIVTDAVGNSQELEATVNPDGTWSVDVTTPLSEGDYTVDASITDPAGNEATASDNGVIDTTAPNAPSVTIANGDDFITADEITNGQVTVTIGLENTNAVAGDTLTVNGTEITLTEEQIAAGEVVTELPTPAEGESLVVTATITDSSGNQSDEGVADAVRDTVAPTGDTTTLIIDDVTADNTVNADEADGEVTVTGRVTGEYAEGDVVTLTINGNDSYTTTVNAAGEWSVAVAGSDLAADADQTIDGVIAATDEAGNVGDVTAEKAYNVDVDAPTGDTTTLIIDDVTADNTVNADEADGEVTVTGRVTGEYAEG
ncbi:retention module-containing protein, partial [Halomonas sp. Ps84H-12]|uniref:retention module-containing protein n=1 Tax=Halomonas sp. Ps84H-12 TaxID=2954501 RepID=UPI0020979701